MKGLNDVSLILGITASLLGSIVFIMNTKFHKNFKFSENSFGGMVVIIAIYAIVYYFITMLFAYLFRKMCTKMFSNKIQNIK